MNISGRNSVTFGAAYALKMQSGDNTSHRSKELKAMISELRGIPENLKQEYMYGAVTTNDLHPEEGVNSANVFLITNEDADKKESIRENNNQQGFGKYIKALIDYVQGKNEIIEINKNQPLASQISVSFENGDLKLDKIG
jgi:hypothetical protein